MANEEKVKEKPVNSKLINLKSQKRKTSLTKQQLEDIMKRLPK